MSHFEKAKEKIAEIVVRSKFPLELEHSLNTLHWLLQLNPQADEVLQLAALAHDIERGLPDPLTFDMFSSYSEYKLAHATRAGELAGGVLLDSGFTKKDAARIAEIIKYAETGNGNSDVQLIMDADSISYFDVNLEWYLENKGLEATRKKISFMYKRASTVAQEKILKVLVLKPEMKKIFELSI